MRSTIRLKLGLAFGTVIILAGFTAGPGIRGLGSLDTNMRAMVEGPARQLETAQDGLIEMLQMIRWEKNILMAEKANDIAMYDTTIEASRRSLTAVVERGESRATVEESRTGLTSMTKTRPRRVSHWTSHTAPTTAMTPIS
jgi:methyl-accepting chemotaxis protein